MVQSINRYLSTIADCKSECCRQAKLQNSMCNLVPESLTYLRLSDAALALLERPVVDRGIAAHRRLEDDALLAGVGLRGRAEPQPSGAAVGRGRGILALLVPAASSLSGAGAVVTAAGVVQRHRGGAVAVVDSEGDRRHVRDDDRGGDRRGGNGAVRRGGQCRGWGLLRRRRTRLNRKGATAMEPSGRATFLHAAARSLTTPFEHRIEIRNTAATSSSRNT